MAEPLITSPAGVLSVLSGVCAFFFFLEEKTKWKLFNYLPPLIFIYAVPAVLSNTGVLSRESPVYGWFDSMVLPMFLVIMLLRVDIASTVKIMGRGVLAKLFKRAASLVTAMVSQQ